MNKDGRLCSLSSPRRPAFAAAAAAAEPTAAADGRGRWPRLGIDGGYKYSGMSSRP
jgi:hypothetical protein